jgi:hypothetical protein
LSDEQKRQAYDQFGHAGRFYLRQLLLSQFLNRSVNLHHGYFVVLGDPHQKYHQVVLHATIMFSLKYIFQKFSFFHPKRSFTPF